MIFGLVWKNTPAEKRGALTGTGAPESASQTTFSSQEPRAALLQFLKQNPADIPVWVKKNNVV